MRGNNLAIAVCEYYRAEMEVVLKELGLEKKHLLCFPGCLEEANYSCNNLVSLLPEKEIDVLLVFGGKCLPRFSPQLTSCLESKIYSGQNLTGQDISSPENPGNAQSTPTLPDLQDFPAADQNNSLPDMPYRVVTVGSGDCLTNLIGRIGQKQLLQSGGLLIPSGLLATYANGNAAINNDRLANNGFCGTSLNNTKKLLLLDTGKHGDQATVFADLQQTLGLTGERLEVGMDNFRLVVRESLLTQHKAHQTEQLKNLRAQASRSMLVNSLLSRFPAVDSIDTARMTLIELFTMFTAAQNLSIHVVENGKKELQTTRKIFSMDRLRLHRYELDDDDGFAFYVPVRDDICIIVVISELPQKENRREYINLALSLEGLVRLIVNSALIYEKLQREIEERRQAEQRIERSEQYFRFLYENAPLPYHSLDLEGKLLEVNKAWLKALGYSPEEVIGRPFCDILAPGQNDKFLRYFRQLAQTGKMKTAELKIEKSDKSCILIQLSATVAYDNRDKAYKTHCIFLDVSGQNRVKELILQSEKLSTIAGLAAGIAHEINTPLSGILQAIQLLELFLTPDNPGNRALAAKCGIDLYNLKDYLHRQEADYFIEGMRKSAIKAAEIISNLLEFSRPVKAVREVVGLARLLDSAIMLVKSDYDLKKKYDVINTVFQTDYDPELPFINCVVVDIQQVVFNLLKNSVQALGKMKDKPDPARVTVRTLLVGDNAHIEVEDNGPGMTEDVRLHAFDPFFTTKDPGEGTGLGLSISFAMITEKHLGHIWVDSEYQQGSRVVIEIPVGDISAASGL